MKNPTVIALVTDNSFYADADGNYILANSPIGKTLLAETETYTTITAEGNYYSTGADSVSPFKGADGITIPFTLYTLGQAYYSANSERNYTATGYGRITIPAETMSRAVSAVVKSGTVTYNSKKYSAGQTIEINTSANGVFQVSASKSGVGAGGTYSASATAVFEITFQ